MLTQHVNPTTSTVFGG